MIFLLVNNEDILNVLGKNIKKVRKEKGYPQDYVAEQINVSTDYLEALKTVETLAVLRHCLISVIFYKFLLIHYLQNS